jgi:hypothetical protein
MSRTSSSDFVSTVHADDLRDEHLSAEPVVPTTVTPPAVPREIGGRDGPEPTRFGDWEKGGRCIDF